MKVNHKVRAKRLSEYEGEEVLWPQLHTPRMPRPFNTILLVVVSLLDNRAEEIIANITRGIDSVLRKYPSNGIVISGDFNKLKLEQFVDVLHYGRW